MSWRHVESLDGNTDVRDVQHLRPSLPDDKAAPHIFDIIECLRDEDEGVSRTAARVLTTLSAHLSPAHVSIIAELMDDLGDHQTWISTVMTMGGAGALAKPYLNDLLISVSNRLDDELISDSSALVQIGSEEDENIVELCAMVETNIIKLAEHMTDEHVNTLTINMLSAYKTVRVRLVALNLLGRVPPELVASNLSNIMHITLRVNHELTEAAVNSLLQCPPPSSTLSMDDEEMGRHLTNEISRIDHNTHCTAGKKAADRLTVGLTSSKAAEEDAMLLYLEKSERSAAVRLLLSLLPRGMTPTNAPLFDIVLRHDFLTNSQLVVVTHDSLIVMLEGLGRVPADLAVPRAGLLVVSERSRKGFLLVPLSKCLWTCLGGQL